MLAWYTPASRAQITVSCIRCPVEVQLDPDQWRAKDGPHRCPRCGQPMVTVKIARGGKHAQG